MYLIQLFQRAADAFVNTFVSTICPPQTRWMELAPPSDELRGVFGKTIYQHLGYDV